MLGGSRHHGKGCNHAAADSSTCALLCLLLLPPPLLLLPLPVLLRHRRVARGSRRRPAGLQPRLPPPYSCCRRHHRTLQQRKAGGSSGCECVAGGGLNPHLPHQSHQSHIPAFLHSNLPASESSSFQSGSPANSPCSTCSRQTDMRPSVALIARPHLAMPAQHT